ncbi:MAG: hypothetical protein QF659_00350 [Dehalococcoidia bacterium]|nr:hypothetical protein [Dehalococcoidia bacterium]
MSPDGDTATSVGWLKGACSEARYLVPRAITSFPPVVYFSTWWESRSAR